MSMLKGDRCTDIILDFIAGGVPGNPSGESMGNYNAVIGKARSTDDLSVRTINGIYDLQSTLVARGMPSGAVGRYQIIQKTLRGLQAKLGLSGNDLFTPETQDRLAVELLKGRGYSDWWRGQMSDEDFAHGLACEWASLPDPQKDGRSHYDGLAGNHASTTLAAVYTMLKQARQAIDGTNPNPIPLPCPANGNRDLVADLVRALQRVVGADPDGIFGPKTAAAITEAQRSTA
jgi:muramidase (phage lysozyme)